MRREAFAFFALVFALSVPLWILGAVHPVELLPRLPVSALMAFCPGLTACALVYREGGVHRVVGLLVRALDWGRIPLRWYVPTLLLMPALTVASYWWMRAMKVSLPELRVSLGLAVVMPVAFLVTAMGEEVGWSGYILDPLQNRWGALRAAALLGFMWAIWHTVPLVQAGRSESWIAWWGLGTVASRVIIVWLYDNTGRSVFAASLYHAMSNLCWQLFPNAGSHYDPRVTSPLIVAVAALVAVVYGPSTLTRQANAAA
jgi:uncharacterized protein